MGIPVVSHFSQAAPGMKGFHFSRSENDERGTGERSRAEEASCRDERRANVAAVLRRGDSTGYRTAERLARTSPILFAEGSRFFSSSERDETGKITGTG